MPSSFVTRRCAAPRYKANKTLLSTLSLSLDCDKPSSWHSWSDKIGGFSICEYCFNRDNTISRLSWFLSRLMSSSCIGWIYRQWLCSAESFRSSAKEESSILLVSSNGIIIFVSKSIFIRNFLSAYRSINNVAIFISFVSLLLCSVDFLKLTKNR